MTEPCYEAIKVCVRVRPLLPHEIEDGIIDCPNISKFQHQSVSSNGIVSISQNQQYHEELDNCYQCISVLPGGTDRTFIIDRVFDPLTSQQTVMCCSILHKRFVLFKVYDKGAKPIIKSVLEGFNGAVIVYGQTSSGKTYTMDGSSSSLLDSEYDCCLGNNETFENSTPHFFRPTETMGIIPRVISTLFEYISQQEEEKTSLEFQLKVSILEIYNEKLQDLLDPSKSNLRIRESKFHKIYVQGLTEHVVKTPKDILHCLRLGQENRATASTHMNVQSSRSHFVFCLKVQQRRAYSNIIKTGKLYLVDLAGSEKVGRSGVEGQTLDEAKMINKSNGNTKTCNSLHVPYRDSKLTRVLQEALGGNSKTCLICTISPASLNEMETLSTLRFGQRAKLVRNSVAINEHAATAEHQLSDAKRTLKKQTLYIQKLENLLTHAGIPFIECVNELQLEPFAIETINTGEEDNEKMCSISKPNVILSSLPVITCSNSTKKESSTQPIEKGKTETIIISPSHIIIDKEHNENINFSNPCTENYGIYLEVRSLRKELLAKNHEIDCYQDHIIKLKRYLNEAEKKISVLNAIKIPPVLDKGVQSLQYGKDELVNGTVDDFLNKMCSFDKYSGDHHLDANFLNEELENSMKILENERERTANLKSMCSYSFDSTNQDINEDTEATLTLRLDRLAQVFEKLAYSQDALHGEYIRINKKLKEKNITLKYLPM